MIRTFALFPVLILMFGMSSSHGQVQFFEQVSNGLSAYLGAKANPEIQEIKVGADYTVEGKFSLGFNYSQPLEDTLFSSSPNLKSNTLNPYIMFEIIEPDKMFPLTFSFKLNYEHTAAEYYKETLAQTPSGPQMAPQIKQNFSRNVFGGGFIIGWRFFMGTNGTIIPSIGYEFSYVKDRRVKMNYLNTDRNIRDKPYHLWHDANLGLPVQYMFSGIFGIMAHPEIAARIGGDPSPDVIVNFHLGIVLNFSE